MQPPAGALPGAGPREDPGAAPAAREPGPVHPLQRPRHAGRGPPAIRLGRNRPSLPRPVRGHLHGRLRPLPPEDRRRRPEADGAPGARLDRLPAPEHAAFRRGAAGQAAAEPGPDLLREQRQRSERSRHPDGPAPHRQRGRHRHPQRLPTAAARRPGRSPASTPGSPASSAAGRSTTRSIRTPTAIRSPARPSRSPAAPRRTWPSSSATPRRARWPPSSRSPSRAPAA